MTTFKEFINEQDDAYQAFLKMRQQAGWSGTIQNRPRGTAPAVVDNPAPTPTRAGTRNPAEVKLSHEVQTAHKIGGRVSPQVIKRLTSNNPEDARSFVAPDRLKAGQAYPFIQHRQAGQDVPGVILYNQMFPLYKLLELLNLH
jgi:hypothetical protein